MPFGMDLAFTIEYVKKVLEKAIVHAAILLEKVEIKAWGQQVGYLRDPNGFILEICTPIQNQ